MIQATHLDYRIKLFAICHLVEGWSYDSIAHEYGTTVLQVQRAVRKCVNTLARKSQSFLLTAELEEEEK